MDSREFAEGYPQTSDRLRYRDDTPEVRELMKVPREWASFFDWHLKMVLKDTISHNPEDLNSQFDVYEHGWAEPFLDDYVQQSQSLAFYDSKAKSAVNELNYHILNKEFMPSWRQLLLPELYPQLTSDEITAMQTRLATRGVELKRNKNDAYKWRGIKQTPSGLVGAISGQLTEVDSAIVMLEIQKEMPNIVLLPAPPSFESASRNPRSVDFIIVDTELWHSRGIQAKTYIESFMKFSYQSNEEGGYQPVRKYDNDFVTLIDGTIDLGSSILRKRPGMGKDIVPDPGQISHNYLIDNKNVDLIKAKNNIKGRILHDLYKN